MRSKRTYDEMIEELQMRQKQLLAREQQLKKRKTVEERKQRTHRLIGLGAVVESVLGRPTTDEDKDRLLQFLIRQEENGKYFTKAMNPPNRNEIEEAVRKILADDADPAEDEEQDGGYGSEDDADDDG